MENQFQKLALRAELVKNLDELEFYQMTPIQEKGLPIVLKGEDVVGQAKTGSGKTASFGLAILNTLNPVDLSIKSLILCPTRELAEQVAREVRMLARLLKNVRVLTLCGGTAQFHQEKSLSHGAHIIVGTPGRILRLLKDKIMDVSSLSSFVLDEADKMLDMGFLDDISAIERLLPKDRQTMLFSATFPDEIEALSSRIQRKASFVQVKSEHDSSTISQRFFKVEGHKEKEEGLLKILDHFKPSRLIIFCRTKIITDKLCEFLNNSGVFAEAIHGDLQQNQRTRVLTQFSNKSLSALVATDVAARGLDIQGLPAVVNFDLPSNAEDYIHRIGRTGRAGEVGEAINLFVERDLEVIEQIEALVGEKYEREEISDLEDLGNYDLTPPMTTIYIAGGKKSKLRPGDILGAIIKETGIAASDVGDIDILNIVSFVAIKSEQVQGVIKKLQHGKIKNRKFRVGLA